MIVQLDYREGSCDMGSFLFLPFEFTCPVTIATSGLGLPSVMPTKVKAGEMGSMDLMEGAMCFTSKIARSCIKSLGMSLIGYCG